MPSQNPKIDLIAGNGKFPLLLLDAAKSNSEPDREEDVDMLIRFIEASELRVIK